MKNLLGRWLFLFMLALPVFPVGAQGLQILTEEDPPYSLTGPDKKPTGYGVEIVTEIQKRVKNQDAIPCAVTI